MTRGREGDEELGGQHPPSAIKRVMLGKAVSHNITQPWLLLIASREKDICSPDLW